MIVVGILGLQGDIQEHEAAVRSLGLEPGRVRTPKDLARVTHLILPGGESTTIGKLLRMTELDEAIKARVEERTLQVYGTCAGAILLAKGVDSPKPVNNLGLIDVKIERNAYGSQIDSFSKTLIFEPTGREFEATFIRAPRVVEVGGVFQKATFTLVRDCDVPVMLEQGNVLISTFHPELTRPAIVHKYFLSKPVAA